MPSTASPLLRLELMTTGDQAGQWGNTTNTNLGSLLEGSIAGLASVLVTSANQALQTVDYAADQARMAIISLSTSGAVTTAFNVYAPPNVSKTYVIYNTSVYTATIYNSTAVGGTTAAGSGVSIPAGGIAYVFSTGSNFFSLNSLYGGSTAALRVDSSGNVGIGVTPSAATLRTLQINQASTITSPTDEIYISQNAVYDGAWKYIVSGSRATRYNQQQSSGAHVWAGAASGTAGSAITFSELMRLDSSGNLGLGVTPSAWGGGRTLDIRSYSSFAERIGGNSDLSVSWNAYIDSGAGQGTGYKYKVTGDLASAYSQNGKHVWYIAPSGTAGNAISFTQAMTLDASGNLGIGTGTPRAQTHVFGLGQSVANLTDAGNRGGMLRVSDNNAAAGSGGAVLFASQQGDAANSLGFAAIKGILTSGAGNTVGDLSVSFRANTGDTNLTELIRITSSGNIGLGTSSPGGNKISALTSPGTNSSARFSNTTASAEVGVNSSSQAYFGSTSNHATRLIQNNTTQLQINTSGLVQIDNGYGSLATFYGCRAWINFDGTSGSIGTGRGSGNVSGVTDNGTGDYTINFTTAMPDANYAVTGVAKEYDSATNSTVVFYLAEQTVANTLSTSFVRVHTATGGASTATDAVVVCVAVFR